jgi:hypothetical protein
MTERQLRTPYIVDEDRCDHTYPIMVTPIGAESYYASCLACLTRGPKRASSWTAYRALKEGVGRLHQQGSGPLSLPHSLGPLPIGEGEPSSALAVPGELPST